MEEELSSIRTEIGTTDFGLWALLKAKEELYILTKIFMKVNGTKERETDMES